MQRVAPEGEFRSNVHRGAATKHIDLTDEEKEIAVKLLRKRKELNKSSPRNPKMGVKERR